MVPFRNSKLAKIGIDTDYLSCPALHRYDNSQLLQTQFFTRQFTSTLSFSSCSFAKTHTGQKLVPIPAPTNHQFPFGEVVPASSSKNIAYLCQTKDMDR
jgi:hypothetical protein